MTFLRISISIFLFTFFFSSTNNAEIKKPVCTDKQEMSALSEASTLPNWDRVYKSFKQYSHCDDGAISEGYSDTIGRLLTEDWKHFDRLHELCSSDKQFQQFILKHIDMTVSVDILQKIIDNARLHCPSEAKKLCEAIESKASAVWKPKLK